MAQFGNNSFTVLNTPTSARSAAMGGQYISFSENDVQLILENPAFYDTSYKKQLVLNYTNYIADVNSGQIIFTNNYKNTPIAIGFQYFSYGEFTRTDATGTNYGTFSSGDFIVNATYGKKLTERWRIGTTLNFIVSNLDANYSVGTGINLGSFYNSERFTAGFVLRNIGIQWNDYTGEQRHALPFNAQASISKKIAYAPIRITLLANNLQRFDLIYSGENFKAFSFENIFRHFVPGLEFSPSKNFSIQFAYNHLRRAQLALSGKGGFNGFSLGTGFKIGKLHFNYALANYNRAGTAHHLTVTRKIGQH